MSTQIVTPSPEQWDEYVRAHPRGHVLGLSAWGALKSAYGWTCDRVAISKDDAIVGGAQLLLRPLPLHLGTMAYCTMGSMLLSDENATDRTLLWQAVDQRAKQHHAAFLKLEPGLFLSSPPRDLPAQGLRESPQTVQPPNTILIDITDDEETIMARMNQGTRRKIRQSLKHGIRFFEAQPSDVPRFTAMMQITGSRNDFGVHEPGYYQKAYDLFVPRDAALILAEHEGDILAGVFVFQLGEWSWYLYGASSNEKRTLMGSYGVQWKAIEWAKARGARYYDMWGIPDDPEAVLEAEFETRSDGLWGVYGFKRGWGGRVIRSMGAWDRVYNPLIYRAYQVALKVRGDADR